MSLPLKVLSCFLFALTLTAAFAQSTSPAPPPPPGSASSNASGSSLVIVLDTSAQNSGSFSVIRKAATDFLKSLGEDREVAVVSGSAQPALVADFNSDSDQLVKKVADLKPHGSPSIQQAVQFATQHASEESDHPVVVAFVRNPDANSAALSSTVANVPVYVIASPDSKWKVQDEMQQLAVKSGGTAFFPSNGRELDDVVREIANRVSGEPGFAAVSASQKHALAGYERLIVHDIPIANTKDTTEAAGGEDLLMQQVLVSRIQKAHLFPIVVNGSDTRSVEYASNAPVGKVLELRASIIGFRRGNRLQRQTLGFRGGSKMKLRVILVDAATNKPVTAFVKEGSYASGLWGGSQEEVQSRAILNVANAIVDELKKMR